MSFRRMLPFLFINVIVSTVVVLAILFWWDSRHEEVAAVAPSTEFGPEGTALEAQMPAVVDPGAGESEAAGETEEPQEAEATDDGRTVHIVQAGDTLGRISELYDVPVEDIASANDIVNVNSISVGQELLIPVGGLPTETPAPSATATADAPPTPRPTEPLPEGTAVIEISEVVAPGELPSEAVRISNTGTRPLVLRGWELSDEDGHVYQFVDVTLFGSSSAGSPSILVHTETGQNGPSDLYWGQETAIWESGETATLRDAEGTVQATYEIP